MASLDRDEKPNYWRYLAGVVFYLAICGGLYLLFPVVDRRSGFDWAEVLLTVFAFCAIVIAFPVKRRITWEMRRRQCAKEGHLFKSVKNAEGVGYTVCQRCYLVEYENGQAVVPGKRNAKHQGAD